MTTKEEIKEIMENYDEINLTKNNTTYIKNYYIPADQITELDDNIKGLKNTLDKILISMDEKLDKLSDMIVEKLYNRLK